MTATEKKVCKHFRRVSTFQLTAKATWYEGTLHQATVIVHVVLWQISGDEDDNEEVLRLENGFSYIRIECSLC